jgi:uncharacterized 2Fe-2S/4Fe-4S cluster protein (DUF4445 family)
LRSAKINTLIQNTRTIKTMTEYTVKFDTASESVTVPNGTLLSEAASLAGVKINQPCGGQGRCGRCAVKVESGNVRRRSTLRLSAEDVDDGYALACQTVVEGNVEVTVPPQEAIRRRLTTDRTAVAIKVPEAYSAEMVQSMCRVVLNLSAPSVDDQTDDWSRLQAALRQQTTLHQQENISDVEIPLSQLQKLGATLREGDWHVTVTLDVPIPGAAKRPTHLINVQPGRIDDYAPLWGIAVDIGTTTVSVWMVDLISGEVKAQVAEYNGQIARGEDVISRIIYDGKKKDHELRGLVTETINVLLDRACKKVKAKPSDIVKATITGNSIMIHLLLGIPADSIRHAPFITALNQVPRMTGRDVLLNTHPEASVHCMPGVASYVGSDISAGVLSSGMDDTEKISLFIDVGTNGEMVLGNNEWLVTCACSAGPALEGGSVLDGMRATTGAIEEIWISDDHETSFRVIGETKPLGICGSGLISLLAEAFLTGVLDKGGNVDVTLPTARTRDGEHGPEYVVVWADETEHGRDIVITRVDIDNLLRTKASIYAGFTVLAESVGIPMEMIEQMIIGGSFGQYINVEKAVEIGLLPDMPWENFHFLGNTSVRGSYMALIDENQREKIADIAARMTYIELSADNTFYDAFTSALFLPHTDLSLFPTVQEAMDTQIKDKS